MYSVQAPFGGVTDNHLRKAPIEIVSSPDVNRNLTPMCHRNLTKRRKMLAQRHLGNVMNQNLSIHLACSDKGQLSIVENAVDYDMLYETKGVGPIGNLQEDLDYDPKHDEVFDDDEHILKDVPISMNNFNFNPDPKHDLSIIVVEVHEHDLDVINYESFGSHLDDGIDFRLGNTT
ncbi:hypothetical protein Tco_0221825 [Tanacetum coccineum]